MRQRMEDIVSSGNGMSLVWHQAITWRDANLCISPVETTLIASLIELPIEANALKMSTAKCQSRMFDTNISYFFSTDMTCSWQLSRRSNMPYCIRNGSDLAWWLFIVDSSRFLVHYGMFSRYFFHLACYSGLSLKCIFQLMTILPRPMTIERHTRGRFVILTSID